MLRTTTLVAFVCFGASAGAQTFFYGGDPDMINGLVSGQNLVSGGQAETYDDFAVGATTDVGSIFGNFFMDPTYSAGDITQAYFEIRSGMSDGNGGTIVDSGTVTAFAVDTGHQALGLQEFNVTAQTDFSLDPGTYWVTLAPVGNGAGDIFIATTHGTNGIGGPLSDGDSFYNAVDIYTDVSGHAFESTADELGGTAGDFSYGMAILPAPEPASLALFAVGVLGLIQRRRRSSKR